MCIANRLVDVAIVSIDRGQGPGVKNQRVHWAAFLMSLREPAELLGRLR